MGYRNYLGSASKKDHEELKGKTEQELIKYQDREEQEDGGWFSPRHAPYHHELYELGKYCDFGFESELQPFFEKVEISDGEFLIMEKKHLLIMIDFYRGLVEDYYKKVLRKHDGDTSFKDEDQIAYHEIKTPAQVVGHKVNIWGDKTFHPYNLNEKINDIVSSWEYEYAVFELVRISNRS